MSSTRSSSTDPRQTPQRGDDDRVDPSTPPRRTSPQTRLANIPDEDIKWAFKSLGRFVIPRDDDDDGRSNSLTLKRVWLVVNDTLEQDSTLKGLLVDRNEFLTNVKRKGERKFIDSLKALAENGTWADLFEDEVFFLNATLVEAAERAWERKYRGDVATVLLETISNFLDKTRQPYSMQANIVNSSGTGKSRMVDQLATKIITVHMCLRPETKQGFPPADATLRSWVLSKDTDDQVTQAAAQKRLYGFVYALLTVTRTTLETIESQREVKGEMTGKEGVIDRQAKLASAFRDYMTKGQSFKGPNAYRENFYNKVIESANKYMESVPEDRGRLDETAKRLSKFVDPNNLLDRQEGSRRPLVIFAFDEAQILNDNPPRRRWNLFSELRRILRRISRSAIFSLFLSTNGNFQIFSSEIRPDSSNRVRDASYRDLNPITEISFDDLTYSAPPNAVTLDRVVQMDWISHLGRPLLGSYWDAMEDKNENLLMEFAKAKLLDGPIELLEDDRSGSLACLSVRLALDFNMNETAGDIVCTQVERHMRLCLSATVGWERFVTIDGSEPFLAEAAYELMNGTQSNPVHHLANHPDLDCVDRGRRGELVATLLIMQAFDAARAASSGNRWVSVDGFMKELLPPAKYQILHGFLPTFWRSEERETFLETFRGYGIWFNHVIKVEKEAMISADNLWKFITRGAMVLCSTNKGGVDIVLPVCNTQRKLSRDTVSHILVRVKNSEEYELDIDETLFDQLNPIKLGLFPDDVIPKPVIRIVFALTSGEAGVTFSQVRGPELHRADPFTAFDVWFAGLSTATFKHIDEDLDSYRTLLERSVRPHDAFELLDDWEADDETRYWRGSIRRNMAPLGA